MKNLGKIVTLTMALSLALVLAACGGSNQSSSQASSESAATAETTSAATTDNSATPSSTTKSYGNDYFGIDFNLPEGWTIEGVSATQSVAGGDVDTTGSASEIDMVAVNQDNTACVIVAVGEANDNTAGMIADSYLETRQNESIASLGSNYSYVATTASVTFAGIDRALPAYILNLEEDGNKCSICQAVAEKDGNFMSMTSIAETEDEAIAAFENFSATVE